MSLYKILKTCGIIILFILTVLYSLITVSDITYNVMSLISIIPFLNGILNMDYLFIHEPSNNLPISKNKLFEQYRNEIGGIQYFQQLQK